jgi:hypothetical protein
MTGERDIERVLDRWFNERPREVADRVLDDVAYRIDHQRQQPVWLVLWRNSPRMTYVKSTAVIAAAVLLIVAGFAVLRPSTGPGAGRPSPTVIPSPTTVPSPSVGVAGACDLMTADEARNALHLSSPVTRDILDFGLSISSVTFPSPFCGFRNASTSLFVLRYEKGSGTDAFNGWKSGTGAETVSGLGEGAIWYPSKTTLYILKGNRLVTIMPLNGPDPTLTLEAAKAIGAIVVTRM